VLRTALTLLEHLRAPTLCLIITFALIKLMQTGAAGIPAGIPACTRKISPQNPPDGKNWGNNRFQAHGFMETRVDY